MFGNVLTSDTTSIQFALHQIKSCRLHSVSVNGDPIEQLFRFRFANELGNASEIKTTHPGPLNRNCPDFRVLMN